MNFVSNEIYEKLENYFPNAKAELDFGNNFELLIAVILSSQCTDKRVNLVTKKLFEICKTPQDFINISYEQLCNLIYACGFYHNKAKNIKSACQDLVNKFDGQVPGNRESLESLAGVGRKTASVVLSVGFNINAIAVDTHIIRVSGRIGLSKSKLPLRIEQDLMSIFPENRWNKLHHLLIFLGRRVCTARKPNCDICPISEHCNYFRQNSERS